MTDNIGSYYDFAGLSTLRAKAVQDVQNDRTIRRVGEEFEALFYQMLLDTMKRAQEPLKSDLLASDGMDQVQDLFHTEVAHAMSKRNALGISDWLARIAHSAGSAPDIASGKAD